MDKKLESLIESKLLTEEQLKNRVMELGAQITKDYENVEEDLIILCLLRGSLIFTADLCREIKLPLKMDFMGVSSYGDGAVSTREVKIVKDLDETIKNKHVIIVEDIIDTGRTLKKIKEVLESRGPKSVKICTLLDKPSRREVEVDVDYAGFEIPDKFVVGYGLDYAQNYRALPYIGIVKL